MKAYTAARWASGACRSGIRSPGAASRGSPSSRPGVFYPGDLPFLLPGACGPAPRHRAPPRDRGGRDGGLARRPRHVARRRPLRRRGLRGRRRVPLARSRLQQLRDGVVPPVALPGARHAVRGEAARRGLRASRSRSRFSAGEPALAAGGALAAAAVALATRARSRPAGGPAAARAAARARRRPPPRRRPRGAAAALPFFELAASLGPAHGRDASRGARAARRASDLVDLVLPPPAGADAGRRRPDAAATS